MAEPGAGTLSADLQVLVDAWSGVAVDLYRRLVAPGEALHQRNLVTSPSSVATVLAMILPGARGATADEIATALHSRLDPERMAAAAGSLDHALLEQARADELDLRISNAVWTQDGLALRQEFERALVEAFRARLHRADFRRDPEAARRAINQLVSAQTAGKVPELFDAGAIPSDASLVLTNAIYLQARWQEAFDPAETRPEPFHVLDRGTTEAVMLHRQGRLGYAQGDGWRAVELPYRGGRLVMDVILPDEGGFDGFRAGLEVERLREVVGALDSREVRLTMPKFSFDSDLDLRGPLEALGMRTAFTDTADFSGISEEAAMRVDRVVQRAHVEVDERGTTAAAATGGTMRLVSAVIPRPPIDLRVDRSFLFAVRDRMSGTLLFIGQVTNPAA
ncbi:MAG TPA: serpin family protein [Actinomycetes bacterium]|nr:serpin family protein [Actinomycetes bacterium]